MNQSLLQLLLCLCVQTNGPCKAITPSWLDTICHRPGFCAPVEIPVCVHCRRLCVSPIPPSKRQGLLPSLHCNSCHKERRLSPRTSLLLLGRLCEFSICNSSSKPRGSRAPGLSETKSAQDLQDGKRLSRWQEPDDATRAVLRPGSGCFQTFPSRLKTRSCRLCPTSPRRGSTEPARGCSAFRPCHPGISLTGRFPQGEQAGPTAVSPSQSTAKCR